MKKWICTILSLLLTVMLALPVKAEEGTTYIVDQMQAVTDSLYELNLEALESSVVETTIEIPDQRLKPRLVDDADLLTYTEESELLTSLDEISERQQCDVVVVTVDSTEGKTPMQYADDFYDYNGYGMGENADGILLLISMEGRDWWISTCGFGITAFTDAGIDYIADDFLSYLSDGDYAKAFETYAKRCDQFLTQAKTGEPYDNGNMPKGTVAPIWIIIDLAIGWFIAYIIASGKKSKLTTVTKEYTAENYVVPGSLQFYINTDRFITMNITSRRIVREESRSSGGSSGSSTHTSSSGRSHGGSGGKF